MIHAHEMTESEFSKYKPFLIEKYAQDISGNLRIPINEARSRAATQTEGLLSQGLSTPNHFLYDIQVKDGESDYQIGYLWLNVDEKKHSCFIWDFYLHESFRSKGWGRKTLELLDKQMSKKKIQKIGLHVFADNAIARDFYAKRGYQVTSLNMQKWLEV